MGSRASNGIWGLKILVPYCVACMWFSVHMIFHRSLTAVLNKDYTTLKTEVTKPRFVLQSEEAVVSEMRSDR
jgi:hypothetical protein